MGYVYNAVSYIEIRIHIGYIVAGSHFRIHAGYQVPDGDSLSLHGKSVGGFLGLRAQVTAQIASLMSLLAPAS